MEREKHTERWMKKEKKRKKPKVKSTILTKYGTCSYEIQSGSM